MSSGTGFVYAVESDQGTAHFLATNKHVLDGAADSLKVQMVAADAAGEPLFGQSATIDLTGIPGGRVDHPDAAVDVSVVPFGPIVHAMEAAGQRPFFRAVTDGQQFSDEDVAQYIDAVEEVTFIGYPDNIFDDHNFTPIARTGITATPIALDFGGKPQFLIDASVFPGSSGSPVFLLDRAGVYKTKDGNTSVGGRFGLLGVLHAVRVRQVEADVVQIPTRLGVRIADPLNLGVVFKASAIDACVDIALSANGLARRQQEPTQPGEITEADDAVRSAET